MKSLEKMHLEEEQMATMFHFERERINYFWMVLKKEVQEMKEELYNKERELNELQLSHDIEIKQKKQMYYIYI